MYNISIIMPIFNVEEYIERSIKSILNQTMNLKDIEVIMVDDCSTDNTPHIIKKYSDEYPNFTAIYNKINSGGASIPRNMGLNIASGKYIMFLDPDDEYAEDMCETLYNKITATKTDLVKCNHELISPTYSRLDYLYDKKINEIEIDCNTDLPPYKVSVCNVIHKKELLDKHNIKFENVKNAEDMLFSLTEFLNADRMIFLNNYHGYKYYTNETLSHHSKANRKNLDGVFNAWYKTRDLIKSKNRPDILSTTFKTTMVPFFTLLMNYDGDKKEYLKKVYEFEKSIGVNFNIKFTWANILNKLIMKKHFTIATYYMAMLNLIRNGPLLKLYRKTL